MDELGRAVTTRSALERESTEARRSVETHRSYDDPSASYGLGRLTRTLDASGATETDYDALGRLAQMERTLPSAFLELNEQAPETVEARFEHDLSGNLESLSIQSADGVDVEVTYHRDDRGRATHVTTGTDAFQAVSGIEFDAQQRLVGAEFGSGVSATWEYDPLTQYLTGIEYQSGGDSVASVYYPEIDEMGNLLREERFDGADALLTEKVHSYDALNRLESSVLSHPLGNTDEVYTYSAAGSVSNAGPLTYRYRRQDLPQAVTTVSEPHRSQRSLTYDKDGQLVRDQHTGDSYADGGAMSVVKTDHARDFTWDAAGCLEAVTATYTRGPTFETALICDAAGNTVARTTTDADGVMSSRFDIAGIGEIRPLDGVFLLRLPVGGTVQLEEAWALDTGERVVEQSGFILNDARKSVLARTAFNGEAVVEEAEYDAWGATESISDLPAPTHQFTGVEPDPVVGLYHFGVRAYDPTLRRWLSPDPLYLVSPELDEKTGAEWNLYSYSSNNPVVFVDPEGLSPWRAVPHIIKHDSQDSSCVGCDISR